jgi:thioredoxin reductase (NADPH)
MTDLVTKLLIVGSGPAGLTAAIYAGRAGLQPIVAAGALEKNNYPGGQLMITTEVENYPGFPDGITGPELMERLFEQARKFDITILDDNATDFKFHVAGSGSHVVRVGDVIVHANAIILANGARAKWLGAPGEKLWINRGISACATCDGPLPAFRNKPIYVVGGGDSACEEALFLTRFASRVYMIHRRDTLRASKIMASRVLNHSKITILWNTIIMEYMGDSETGLTGIKLYKHGESTDWYVPAAAVFMAIGHEPNTTTLQGSGLELDTEGYIQVRDNVYTNIRGVFAAGDVHDTIYRQAITAAGFGCMAAITAERWLEEPIFI